MTSGVMTQVRTTGSQLGLAPARQTVAFACQPRRAADVLSRQLRGVKRKRIGDAADSRPLYRKTVIFITPTV
jgi:hypothetical protein